MKCSDYMDALRARYNLKSDYALAAMLNQPRNYLSRWRSGRIAWDDATARHVATLLDVDPAVVIAAAHAERARDPADRAVWLDMVKRLGGGFVGLMLWVLIALPAAAPQDAQAASRLTITGDSGPQCILCQTGVFILHRLRRLRALCRSGAHHILNALRRWSYCAIAP